MGAYGLLLLTFVLIPTIGWADPEVFLTIGGAASSNAAPRSDFESARDPEAGARPLHEGDVVPLPACEAALRIALRASVDSPKEEHVVVRLMKRRLSGDACEIEVLTIGPTQRTAAAPSKAFDQTNGRHLPCGTQLIEIRESRSRGRSGSVNGRKPSDTCADIDRGMESPLQIYWLDSAASQDGPPDSEPMRPAP